MENHFRHKRLTPADAFVCLAILSMVNYGDGSCFPSYAAIAELAGVGKTAVWSAIRKLRALGLLDWDMRIALHADGRYCQTSNAYVFVVVVRVPWPSTDLLSSLLKTLDSYFTPQRAEPETKLPAELAGVPPGLAAALASLQRSMNEKAESKNG
jgi:Helix-turn-helix domain